MKTGNSVLCSKEESEKLVVSIQENADRVCKEFNEICNPTEPVSIQVKNVKFVMGYGVAADLYFGEQCIKCYPLAELAILDVVSLTLKASCHVMDFMRRN